MDDDLDADTSRVSETDTDFVGIRTVFVMEAVNDPDRSSVSEDVIVGSDIDRSLLGLME